MENVIDGGEISHLSVVVISYSSAISKDSCLLFVCPFFQNRCIIEYCFTFSGNYIVYNNKRQVRVFLGA